MEDFWPSFGEIPDVKTPGSILIEQGLYLEKASQGLLKTEVQSAPQMNTALRKEMLKHVFKIVAPLLGDYSIILLNIEHDIFMYPLVINFKLDTKSHTIHNEQELMESLRHLFNHTKTTEIIKKLLIQSKAAKTSK